MRSVLLRPKVRTPKRPNPTRVTIAHTVLFSWALTADERARIKAGEKVKRKRSAPTGYAFNTRADLISLKRDAKRRDA